MKNTIFVPNSDLYIDYRKSETKHTTFQHYHDAYEIYIQLGGKRYIYHDNLCHTMERGDVMVLEPFAIHYTTSEDAEGYERIVLNFAPEKLNGLLTDSEIYMLRDKLRSGVMHVDDNALTELKQRFDTCQHYSEKKGFLSEKLLYSAVMQFVMTIIEYSDSGNTIEERKIPDQIISVIKHINAHYTEDMTVSELADIAHMSKYYFCRRFHDITGATALEYLNNIRLIRVHNMLSHTSIPLGEIAMKTGYSSVTNLTRTFKKVYGITPTEFKKSIKQ